MNKEVEANTTLSHYRIVRKLGAGGMGEVYLAEDTRLRRKVALKVLPESLAADADRLLRFEREAFAASALNHPNILTIYEFAREGDTHFLAAEFVAGETLREKLERESLTVSETLDIAQQIASALQAAHAAGIIHRDIKPENVMIRADGYVKVLDFGLAKLSEAALPQAGGSDAEAETRMQLQTQAGMIMGTVAYMSPEQARGRIVDARTDIFSLGAVLYEMLARRQPFTGVTVNHTIVAILEKEPPHVSEFAAECPREVERIINKTLAKEPTARYQTAKELFEDLKDARQELEFQSRLEKSSSPNRAEAKTQILQAPTTDEATPHSAISNLKSIAVLPFSNMSADDENEYFCDGLAEELLNALAKIEDLKVAARTSAFSFKGKNIDASEIGNALNVKTILEGSVRRSGNKLRISVQLVNASDGYHLWSERYDREMRDIFDVQDEIALAVVDALKLKLFGDEKAAVLKRGTENREAYELYLKGRFFFNKFTKTGNEKAIEFYEQAIAKEPNYAHAFAALSSSYNYSWYLGFGETAKCISEAKAAVNKALVLDQSLAEAHFALALLKFNYERDWTEAEKAFQRAIELNPNYAESHEHYGMFLAVMGRETEAVAAAKRALELAPLALKTIYIAGWAFWLAGHARLAKEQGEKLLEMEPNFSGGHTHLGVSFWGQREYEKALNELETDIKLGGGNDIKMLLGLLYGIVGEREKANQLLTEFQQLDEQGIFTANQQAFICAGLGEMDRAFDLLEQAADRHEGALVFLKQFSSLFPKFHNDSRMTDLLNRIGLPTDKTNQPDDSLEAKTLMLSLGESKTEQLDNSETRNTNSELKSKQTTNPKSKIRNPKSKWWLFGLLGLILIVGGFFGYKSLSPTNKQIESIAVMPFVNESGNADVEYLSDGMPETLIKSLSQIPNLNVKPRSSVFRYKGKDTNLQTIAKELNVQAILNGRVVQRGDGLTLSLELVDAAQDKVIWTEQYQRKTSDLVSLQSEIARDVSTNLKAKLSGAEETKVTKAATSDPEAYQAYLKGRYYWNRRTAENLKKAIEQFKIATDRDPNYALAFSGLADCYAILNDYAGTPTSESVPQAKAYATRALSLDDQLAEPHATLGSINQQLWQWAEAEKEYKRAIEINPNYATAYHWYSILLRVLGRNDEAAAMIKRAHEIDPLSSVISVNVTRMYQLQNNHEASIENSLKIIELDPNFAPAYEYLGLSHLKRARNAEAVAALEKAAQLTDRYGFALGNLGYVYAATGKRTEALAIIKELEEKYTRKEAIGQYIAAVYVGLGDKDKAFEWLEKDFQVRNGRLAEIRWAIPFESLRDDPRYKDLLKRMNLPE